MVKLGAKLFDALGSWSTASWTWTVVNGGTYRLHARLQLQGVTPGDVYRVLASSGPKTLAAVGGWAPVMFGIDGNESNPELDEFVSLDAGDTITLYVQQGPTDIAALTLKAAAYDTDTALESGSLFEVQQLIL